MMILVINCGSSSAKYKLFDMRTKKLVTGGVIERIGSAGSGGKDHYDAVRIIKERLNRDTDRVRVDGIGHRVVHGGEKIKSSVVINKKVLDVIGEYAELAPLHNPPSLLGIKACMRYFPRVKQVAVFDTAFHQSMPPEAYVYGIPYEFYKKYAIRRYGFHGTSHRFVAGQAAKKLARPLQKLKIVTAHLGNGCSMAAVSRGKSIDTTMGLTPLEGLLMGTRSGDLDPAVVTFLMKKEHLSAENIDKLLNEKSGFLGVSGVSNDMRDMLNAMKKGSKRARLAFEIFLYRIKKYIGAYRAVMGGLDAVVFTGGIGEHVTEVERRLSKELSPVVGRKCAFLTIPTNEELLIAQDTYKMIK